MSTTGKITLPSKTSEICCYFDLYRIVLTTSEPHKTTLLALLATFPNMSHPFSHPFVDYVHHWQNHPSFKNLGDTLLFRPLSHCADCIRATQNYTTSFASHLSKHVASFFTPVCRLCPPLEKSPLHCPFLQKPRRYAVISTLIALC